MKYTTDRKYRDFFINEEEDQTKVKKSILIPKRKGFFQKIKEIFKGKYSI